MTDVPRNRPVSRADALLAGLLFVLTFVACFRASHWELSMFKTRGAFDVWYDADCGRVLDIETNRKGNNDRTSLHPFYPFVTYPLNFAVRKVTGADGMKVTRGFHAAIGGAWLAFFFLLLRRMRLPRPDAVIFAVLAASSAAAFFWLPAIETFAVGALSMLPALFLVAGDTPASEEKHIFAGLTALGITITNWMVAAFAAVVDLSRRRAVTVGFAVLLVTLAVGMLQNLSFPNSASMVLAAANEGAWVFTPESGGPFAILRTFFFSGMVAPEIRFLTNFRHPAFPLLTMQFGNLFTGTRWSWIATPAWALLLAFGFHALLRSPHLPRLRTVLGLTILYQLLLHMLYGRETFLYAIHYVPLLVPCAALASRSAARPLVLALALVAAAAGALNNARQFGWAHAYAGRFDAVSAVDDHFPALFRKPRPAVDPTWLYRFHRDVLHWRPRLTYDLVNHQILEEPSDRRTE